MKKLGIIFFILLFAISASAAMGKTDITGNWDLKIKGPMGNWEIIPTHFELKGEKVIVTQENPMLGTVKGEGSLKGSSISWTMVMDTPMGEMKQEMMGVIENGTMKGTSTMNTMPGSDWSAVKK